MKLKKYLMLIMCLLLFGTGPAFADGGIPLWIFTVQNIFGYGIGYGLESFGQADLFFICAVTIVSFIILMVVVSIEMGIFGFILKEECNWKKLLKTVFLSNIFSTVIGSMIFAFTSILSNDACTELLKNLSAHNLSFIILGTYGCIFGGLGLLLNNIFYLIISYYSEYFVSLKLLKEYYEIKKIKKAVIVSNLVTYAIPILVSIYGTYYDLLNIKDWFIKINKMAAYHELFFKYCLGTIILPVVLIGIGVFVIKKYIKKEEAVNLLEDIKN